MQIKALSTFAISLSATAVFAVANVAFAESYESKDNISSISVAVTDSTLDPTDIKTRQVWDAESESFISTSYYDIYDYDNLTLTVSYLSGEEKSYTGTEIASLSAKTETPFIISDNQSEEAWTVGTHTVTCYFGGKSADISFTVEESKIQAVSVTPQYDIKFIYGLDGEAVTTSDDNGVISQITKYNLEGQYYEINITYADGSTARYTNTEIKDKNIHSLKFSQPAGILDIGTHTASCYIDGIKADFSFEIIENFIQEISLSLPEDLDTLTFSKDAVTDTDINGNPYPRFFYDVSSITALVTYTDGTTAEMSLGQLCRDLQDELVFEDEQITSPWQTDNITLNASIRNIPCTLTLNIVTENISGLKSEVTSPFSARLSWDRVYCAGYELWKTDGEASEKVTDIPFGTEAVTVDYLSPDTRYTYAVRSYVFDENGERKYTEAIPTEFKTDDWGKNINATANRTDKNIAISWSFGDSADGFIIEQLISDKWQAIADIPDATITSCSLSDIKGGEKYQFRIKAYKSENDNTYYSGYGTTEVIITEPDDISGLALGGRAGNALRLNWDKNETVSGYIIEQYKQGKWTRVADITDPAAITYRITGLSGSTAYSFRMKSYKIIDGITYYSEYTDILKASTNPSAVSGFCEGGRTSNALRLNWTKNSTADGYIIEQYKSGKWVRIKKITNNQTATYRVSGLTPSSSYKFRIRAYKMYEGKALYSGYSSVTLYTNPSAVRNLKITGKAGTALRLGWDKNNSADGYLIYQYKNGNWARIKKLSNPATLTYRVSGLTKGTQYKFFVVSYKTVNGKAYYSARTYLTASTNK